MSTPTKEATGQTYKLSDEEREELLRGEVEELSDTLGGYQMNTEMKVAWITSIVPPGEELEGSPNTDGIAVEFMLPSEDVFWETFEFPNMRWPEDNEFREFIESLGVYNPNSLSQLVGKEVGVEYDESVNRWTVEGDFGSKEEVQGRTNKTSESDVTDILKLALLVIFVPLAFGSIFALRHYSLVVLVPLSIGVYFIYIAID
jgi:hypothetical protein